MKIKKTIFLVIFFLFLGVFYYLRSQGAACITGWYDAREFEWLNKLSGIRVAGDPMSLHFYLGRIEENTLGPLTQLISGLLFAGFALVFLSETSPRKFGFAVFLYLILTKFDVLLFPPYGDAIGGPFAEAIWLKNNGFDYSELIHQPGYAAGGPKVYVFSVYPTYLALLMKVLPNIDLFLVVNHLFVFIMAAVIVTLFRQMMASAFSRDIAVLSAMVLLYLPLFQSQTEAINMEIPCVLFVVLAARALMQRRIDQASWMAILAIAVKGIGVFAGAAVLAVSILMGLGRNPAFRWNKKTVVSLLALAAVMLFSLSVKFILKDQHVSAGMVNFFAGWPSLKVFFISRLYLWALFIIGIGFVFQRFLRPPQKYDVLVMMLFCTMWFLLFLNFYAVSPRYRLGAYPFLIYMVFYAGALIIRPHALRMLGLSGIMITALFYSYGRFDPPMTENDHVQLERSLEYRNDLKLNQLVVKTIEDKYDNYRVGAPFTIAQLLAIPEMGYTKKNLDVMIYGFSSAYGGIKNFSGMDNLDVSKTVYIGVKTAPISDHFAYPIGPHDRIVEAIEYGNKKAELFMGGIAIEMLYRSAIFRQLQKMRNQ